jgi:hypothetical protein
MVGKYQYIVFCELNDDGNKLPEAGWKNLFANEDKLAKKQQVEIMFRGTPYGVSESYVTVYSTDKPVDELMKMIMETGREKYVRAARTVIVSPLIFA